MTSSLALDSQSVAHELHALLRDIDPARWRDDVEAAFRARLTEIRARLDALVARPAEGPESAAVLALRERLGDLVLLLDGNTPAHNLPAERTRAAWSDFRAEAVPAYEKLAATLRPLALHVPSLRPTNYARNVYHVLSGLGCLLLLNEALTPAAVWWVAAIFLAMAWSFELSRRIFPPVNQLLMWAFKPFAHPHEAWRVNSATWFTTALFVLASLGEPAVATAAIAVLAVGDPLAAVVGRRFGTVKLVNGRSLQGTLAFTVAASLSAFAALSTWFPGLGTAAVLAASVAAAAAGALAELFARRIDDNLVIPLAAAAAASLAFALSA
jgi:dolichol kinase